MNLFIIEVLSDILIWNKLNEFANINIGSNSWENVTLEIQLSLMFEKKKKIIKEIGHRKIYLNTVSEIYVFLSN